jgi:hypothetical protein
MCASPRCPNAAVPGSEFCVAHILLDQNQKLFAECPDCHRPFPVMGACFACREHDT